MLMSLGIRQCMQFDEGLLSQLRDADETAFVLIPIDCSVDVDERKSNYTRRGLTGCGTGNPIDDCWRCDPNWESNRQSLADCAIGFGQNAIGGRNGEIYVVTDDSDDAVTNPKYGTLRWGVIQTQPLWIIFARDMMITLKEELIMNSFKTLDGRGANVHIADGACLTLQYISNVIVHGLHIHDCKSTGDTMVSIATMFLVSPLLSVQ